MYTLKIQLSQTWRNSCCYVLYQRYFQLETPLGTQQMSHIVIVAVRTQILNLIQISEELDTEDYSKRENEKFLNKIN